jgi:hypothetical protein
MAPSRRGEEVPVESRNPEEAWKRLAASRYDARAAPQSPRDAWQFPMLFLTNGSIGSLHAGTSCQSFVVICRYCIFLCRTGGNSETERFSCTPTSEGVVDYVPEVMGIFSQVPSKTSQHLKN